MKNRKKELIGIAAALGLLLLITDSETAHTGAYNGIMLCLQTVIPAIFPFMVLSGIITNTVTGIRLPLLSHLGKLCKIPPGNEMLLITGFLGGYPVGAQCISNAYENGNLTQADARRLMGFCSNAGPAFIFGMTGRLFNGSWVACIIWLIQIVSALAVAVILPRRDSRSCFHPQRKPYTFPFRDCIVSMGMICGWIVLFRILIAFLSNTFLSAMPQIIFTAVQGLLELSCGCIELYHIRSEFARFVLCNCLLSFGGLCVWVQTRSVVRRNGMGLYLPGKLLQTLISGVISAVSGFFLFC